MENLPQKSDDIKDLVSALVKAQADLKAVQKKRTARVPTKSGGEYSYNYADLADVIESYRAALSKHGLVLLQTTALGKGLSLDTWLCHESGQWFRGEMPIPAIEDAQKLGSWLTYLRRYSASAILGIAAEDDDDGARASRKPKAKEQATQPAALTGGDQEMVTVAEQIAARFGNSPRDYIKSASVFVKENRENWFEMPNEPAFWCAIDANGKRGEPKRSSPPSQKWKDGTLNRLQHNLADLELSGEAESFDKATA